ncbi:MAG: ImmA/IrrE family metallo-endopeptidase [Chloroflexi bacterium]|nr:ImmA/IrrE family metallo-endopeptidase [Chloroflexota bacterium]
MPTRQDVPINPRILRWAREQASFSPEQAADRAGIRELKAKGLTGGERLATWESGKDSPTLNDLEAIARAYRRPLLTFFLPEPPQVETRLQDFRTVGDRPADKSTPEFAAFRRQIEALQKEVRTLIAEEGGNPLDFIGSATTNTRPLEIAQAIRNTLEFTLANQQQVHSPEELFHVLREKAGDAGIFTLCRADLGSWHSKISVAEFRGLVISDAIAPFIVINPNDARTALVFTLIHEMAHLWLGESGISNIATLTADTSGYQEREIFCNQVAAEFLVPGATFLSELRALGDMEMERKIQLLAGIFKVSRIVISRRLLDFKRITSKVYWDLYNQWRDEAHRERETRKQREGGPGYFVLTRSKLGSKLLNKVIGAAYDGRLSYSAAARMLGVRIDYFSRLYGE